MEYQALYRKYRPKTFNEVYGQDIIVKTLQNAIKNNKLTHAYLFIGPRGTGKTSIAKIFAKTINCKNITNSVSCETCNICLSSNNNENVDIIEMDAASNNGVDEIREIKNHVTLLPTISKYKIYIIDEVHMLTTGAFNALLKTLEEPPEHVIFILATTEPHKIPLTIISRCQSFEFKPIPKVTLIERLKYICEKEKIIIDDESLELIALDSNGGMRDAIGMLDQLNAYCDGKITVEDVNLLNGRISEEKIEKLLLNLENNYIKECFDFSSMIDNKGKNFTYVCEDIIRLIRNILITKQIEESVKNNINLDNENLIEMISIFNECINNMKNSKDKKIFFDLSLLKIIESMHNNVKKQTNVLKDDSELNEVKQPIQKKETKKRDNSLYDELMLIRLNNILSTADKKSLNEYIEIFNNLEKNITNLDQLKIINLLTDCKICAGSNNGIIICVSNDNLLNELYDNYIMIEDILNKITSNDLKVCILLEDVWKEQRPIFVKKIKNKEKISIIDETDILNKIKTLYNNIYESKNEFDDLIEIGGE